MKHRKKNSPELSFTLPWSSCDGAVYLNAPWFSGLPYTSLKAGMAYGQLLMFVVILYWVGKNGSKNKSAACFGVFYGGFIACFRREFQFFW